MNILGCSGSRDPLCRTKDLIAVSTTYKNNNAYVNEMHEVFSITDTGQSRPVMKDELHPVNFRQNSLWPFLLLHIVDTVS